MKLIFSLVLIGLLTNIAAQNATSFQPENKDQKQVFDKLQIYFEATKESDWEKVLDLIYPPLFDIAPKEQMMEVFKGLTDGFAEVEFLVFEVRDMSHTFIHNGEKYVVVTYYDEMKMKFTGEEYEDPETIESIHKSFKSLYGADNVSLEEDNSFIIRSEKDLFAIADVNVDEWYFLEKKEDATELMDMLIPGEVQKEFE